MTEPVNDHIAACAEIVFKGDPARFRAAMAAPLGLREKLLVLYAFNVEVARAPWVTSEAMIAEMRLQWWHDALGEIAAGGQVRRHEVVTPLADTLSPDQALGLQSLVEARRWDIYPEPFADEAALWQHLGNTTGALMRTGLGLAGGQSNADLEGGFQAMGLAGWLTAVPALMAQNRHPLPDTSEPAIARLAREGLSKLNTARNQAMPKLARRALLAGWQTEPLLKLAMKEPARVANGTLELAPFRAQMRLARFAFTNRW
ncbi:squalene/phytoene synthase family protein [Lentibacter sp. XHP0401]|uniref:squalene/phytoene synthase family protein n=1 Tax=Lentibacter sp. XHP0401 TaxID=2984334 RepID=UPI0021E8646E|nr:squalene/phytoene synthase family protein [Lentibacter sp. XHP0401]MCV2891848.1 squalene/phytoene synthase family protein [Lentibacter sp. XHP0401]